jgi:REP element-mobilizing transposase RayT
MDKYQNKYRIPSARLHNWNYGAMGAYFVTICTQNREHFFGEIVKNEMILTDIGKNAQDEWLKTIALRPDMNLELGNFVVMPNHFHGILIIGENKFNSYSRMDSRMDSRCTDAMHRVSTGNKFGPQSKNLGSIIRGFKSAVTTFAKIERTDAMHRDRDAMHCVSTNNFWWQPRFHDHIIRNSAEFERIQNYIANNVENWKEDKFYKQQPIFPNNDK